MRIILFAIAYYLVHAAGQTVFASNCPSDSPVSCSSSASASCCFESPGGVLLQTQFWDYSPSTGPSDLFTLHGLWPDNCDGTYEQFCDTSIEINNDGSTVKSILVDQFNDEKLYNNLNAVWKDINGKDHSLWAHEWNKHGTCINTIKPSCYSNYQTNQDVYDYYSILYNLFETLPTYKWLVDAGITPSNSKTYTKAQIQNALSSNFGQNVYFKCDSNNAISEVWYFHHIKGSLLQNDFIPIAPLSSSNCPSTGILFPPKQGGDDGGDGGDDKDPVVTKTTTSGSIPTGIPSRGYIDLSGKSGCLISNGKWYTSGTCATYKFAQSTYGGITITSSKGGCGINSSTNEFVCGSSVDASKNQFQVKDSTIGYGGNYNWCLGSQTGGGSTAQTSIKLSDGSCSSFKLQIASK
ncbi:RNY1 [Candida oxycetoniae]|uniref:Ribonuclease T2-like n=1 Tax=Candida oxycetoniae TaxID=497107 RepID=A0AAI9WXZ9_9ASCO|nr:RNY1 [Candida oxycetoniae]KAI3404753.1 RNY1 [Candida oxycetoniae]